LNRAVIDENEQVEAVMQFSRGLGLVRELKKFTISMAECEGIRTTQMNASTNTVE